MQPSVPFTTATVGSTCGPSNGPCGDMSGPCSCGQAGPLSVPGQNVATCPGPNFTFPPFACQAVDNDGPPI